MNIGIELVELLPEVVSELSALGFEGWSEKAILDREQFCVQDNVLHLKHRGSDNYQP